MSEMPDSHYPLPIDPHESRVDLTAFNSTEERRSQHATFSETGRHLLALPHSLTIEEKATIESIIGFSAEDLADFSAQAWREHEARYKLTERVKTLEEQAKIDKKTGAYTMEAAVDIFSLFAIEATMQNVPMFAMFLDVDSLKYANDHTLGGHDLGDLYLQETVSGTNEYFRNNTKVIRINSGGDEFLVVGLLNANRRHNDVEQDPQTELQEYQSALKQFLQYHYRRHPALRQELDAGRMKEKGFRPAGTAVGSVYVLPEDLDAIGADIMEGSRTIDHAIKQIVSATDKLMYADKDGQHSEDLHFTYDDFFPRKTKFSRIEA